MTNHVAPIERSGQSDIPKGAEQIHTLIVLINDRPGAVDRVVSLFRRRRANMQTLILGRGEQPQVIRLTVKVTDSEVGIGQLIEQIRKLVDVQQASSFTARQALTRELALIKVTGTSASFNEIIDLGHPFGAQVVDITEETITLEVSGSCEAVDKLIEGLQDYGIRDIARSGSVAIARGDTII